MTLISLPMPPDMPIEVYKFMSRCCSRKPNRRPYVKGVLMWLQGYLFNLPENKGDILSITSLVILTTFLEQARPTSNEVQQVPNNYSESTC